MYNRAFNGGETDVELNPIVLNSFKRCVYEENFKNLEPN